MTWWPVQHTNVNIARIRIINASTFFSCSSCSADTGLGSAADWVLGDEVVDSALGDAGVAAGSAFYERMGIQSIAPARKPPGAPACAWPWGAALQDGGYGEWSGVQVMACRRGNMHADALRAGIR